MWILFAFGSALFAGLTAILAKYGIRRSDQTVEHRRTDAAALILSGLATGASCLCCWRALWGGPASVVMPIDNLSILVTAAFSRLVPQEKLTHRAELGLALITGGILVMLRG